jgi:hypothetical protein
MEFKMSVNIVMNKDLTIEAESLREATNKAQKLMAEPAQELTITKILFGERTSYNVSSF